MITVVALLHTGFLTLACSFQLKPLAYGITSDTQNKQKTALVFSRILIILAYLQVLWHLFFSGSASLEVTEPALSTCMAIAGALLVLTGYALQGWARAQWRVEDGVLSSPQEEVVDDGTLITSGPYAFVRHPLYLYNILWIVGGLLLTHGSVLFGIAWISNFTITFSSVPIEETQLRMKFGDAYVRYCSATPSTLIPSQPILMLCKGARALMQHFRPK